MKVLIVGGVAGGMSVAGRLRRLSEETEIIVLDKGDYVSFSNCALPYYLSGTVGAKENLILQTPQSLKKSYKLDVRVKEEVVFVDAKAKTVEIKRQDGSTYKESYDKLVLSPGARALALKIEGLESVPHSFLRTVNDVAGIKEKLDQDRLKKVVVLGGGFIGVEAAENLKQAGYDVSLVEAQEQILSPYDDDMVQILQKELRDQGVALHTGYVLEAVEDGKARLSDGTLLDCDFLVLAAGIEADTDFLQGSGVDLDPKGYIKVNADQETSVQDIYALGDATVVYLKMAQNFRPLQLAGPALNQARRVADRIMGQSSAHPGFLGTSAIQVFNYNAAQTGLNERQLQGMGRDDYDSVLASPMDKVGIMPGASPLFLKLIFQVPTGTILGAQAIGKGDVAKRIDTIASMMHFDGTIFDLKDLEQAYAPPFNSARDALHMAAFTAENILYNRYRQVHVNQVRSLVEKGAYILDVREEAEYERGHIKGAHNLPLSQLRHRMAEVPKDRPVYVHCRTGQRSYNATMALQNSGWDNIYNINGSFLFLSFYEQGKDLADERESILTAYNFN
jgi:NADPH-dependent 2,4-dienoyl-CoA reductase/sulfur reductase-like enzyme